MKNRPITVFLNSLGISDVAEQAVARQILEDTGHTRAGKVNMAVHKEPAAQESLQARLAFHCSTAACREALAGDAGVEENPRKLLLVAREACEVCGGSADRRALLDMANAMGEAGFSRIVVVGGTDQKAARIRELCPTTVVWRFVDGLKKVNEKNAASDLKWADVVVIWATTPLPHHVSNLYSKSVHAITAPTSGIAALAREAARFARGRQ